MSKVYFEPAKREYEDSFLISAHCGYHSPEYENKEDCLEDPYRENSWEGHVKGKLAWLRVLTDSYLEGSTMGWEDLADLCETVVVGDCPRAEGCEVDETEWTMPTVNGVA